MRRALVPFAVLAALVLAPAARAQEPRIAPGVSAAGADLSGLTLPEAAQKLYVTFAPVLGRPLSVHAAGRRFPLRPAQARIAFDVRKSARRAFNAGRTAKGKAVDVPLFVTFRRADVDAYAVRVARRVAVAPRDATVRITLRHVFRTHSKPGRAVSRQAIATAVANALADPRAPRVITPRLVRLRPRVTASDLARAYGTIITIDRGRFRLRLFKRLRMVKSYRVAVGQPAFPTPTGRFRITSKQVNPVWSVPNSPWAGELAGTTVQGGSAANPLKARWMGLAGGVGIHGTGEDASIGKRASHGCIRMHVRDVIALYRRVPIGTPVLIAD